MDGVLASSPKEKMRNAVLELTELTKKIILNSDVQSEVGLLTHNRFYNDYYVTIDDLLNPLISPVYNYASEDIQDFKGSFLLAFNIEMEVYSANYPNLIYVIENRSSESSSFYEKAFLSFYLPYDSDDEDLEHNLKSIPTLVPGVIDSNSGLGFDLSGGKWQNVIVNDDSAALDYTLIIQPVFDECSGMGIAPASNVAVSQNIPINCSDISYSGGSGSLVPQPGVTVSYTGNCNTLEKGSTYIREVYIGRVRLKEHYDPFISFTGNGGGSELQFCRGGSRDNIETDSLGSITIDQWTERKRSDFSRRDIRNEEAKHTALIWDRNWQCLGTDENLLVI